MALVNFLKFSSDSGAIISDEEYWNVYFRKRMHGDNLHSLLSIEQSKILGMQVVYGSVGYPSLHREVLDMVGKKINLLIQKNKIESLQRVKGIARIAFDCLQEIIRKKIDQKMQFYYGFNTSDLNAGEFSCDGEIWPIESEKVRSNAGKLASRETKDTLLKVVIDAKAAVFGYDNDGITGYYLAGENSILGYVHEGFEAIGAGKYASGLVFGQDFKAKTIKMRQKGYNPAEGIFELVDSAFLAGDHFKEVGGNYNFIILDRNAGSPEQQYRQIFDDPARLITEIVRAVRSEQLSKSVGIKLIDGLLFKGDSFSKIETEMFSNAVDRFGLELILRGYKRLEVEKIIKDMGEK